MLAHAKELLEYQIGYVDIHPRFNKLITTLRTLENGEGMLEKDAYYLMIYSKVYGYPSSSFIRLV
jgi:hypothetical protein